MKKNLLSVRLFGKQIGILEQTATGKKTFTYDTSATEIISLGMPLREESYGEVQCEAFFGGLLPESETVKKIIGKRYGVSAHNSFALLKAIGYDCAGAISCHAIDEPIISQRSVPLTGKIITEDELYRHIKDLPQKPLFMDIDGLRLSLAGIQDKAAVCMIDGQIALAQDGCPTTHLLKPSSPHYPGIAENEYFCLKIAKGIGLPVPNVDLRHIKDSTFLLIERYDRHIQNKQVERIHQEDFCQALGVLSSRKYQNEGGPSFKDCFELLKKTTQPAIDRNFLASALVFNYLVGNMDAHGKNFALLHNTQSNIRLAPFYDIVCTQVYPTLTSKMAMKIGSKYNANDVLARHWEQLCNEVGYGYPAMKKLIENQAESILKAATQERDILINNGQTIPIIDKIITTIEKNIKKIN